MPGVYPGTGVVTKVGVSFRAMLYWKTGVGLGTAPMMEIYFVGPCQQTIHVNEKEGSTLTVLTPRTCVPVGVPTAQA